MAVRSLKTQDDIRRAFGWTLRELEADRIEASKARTLCYLALSLSQVLSEHDLEARVQALEASSAPVKP